MCRTCIEHEIVMLHQFCTGNLKCVEPVSGATACVKEVVKSSSSMVLTRSLSRSLSLPLSLSLSLSVPFSFSFSRSQPGRHFSGPAQSMKHAATDLTGGRTTICVACGECGRPFTQQLPLSEGPVIFVLAVILYQRHQASGRNSSEQPAAWTNRFCHRDPVMLVQTHTVLLQP